MTIHKSAKSLRLSMNLTQEQFAKELDVTKRTIVQYERHVPPRGIMLLKFADLASKVHREDLFFIFGEAFIKEIDDAGLSDAFLTLMQTYEPLADR